MSSKKQVEENQEEVESVKSDETLDVKSVEDLKTKVNDVVVVGNGDMFRLLCKASSVSQGWMKSTKAMEIPGLGCVVQVTTQQGNNVSEALTFVPMTTIVDDVNGGRKLVSPNIRFGLEPVQQTDNTQNQSSVQPQNPYTFKSK